MPYDAPLDRVEQSSRILRVEDVIEDLSEEPLPGHPGLEAVGVSSNRVRVLSEGCLVATQRLAGRDPLDDLVDVTAVLPQEAAGECVARAALRADRLTLVPEAMQ